MPAPTVSDFRTAFPEFADVSQFSDDVVIMWLAVTSQMVNECRWGNLYPLGVELLAAHNIVLSARDQESAASGAAPGEMTGAVSSKSVDKVSVSYDTASAAIKDAGDYNLTSYGVRFARLSRMFGAGGLQL